MTTSRACIRLLFHVEYFFAKGGLTFGKKGKEALLGDIRKGEYERSHGGQALNASEKVESKHRGP